MHQSDSEHPNRLLSPQQSKSGGLWSEIVGLVYNWKETSHQNLKTKEQKGEKNKQFSYLLNLADRKNAGKKAEC